ncbi:MAG: DUF3021 domain-containing protein [Christensenellaceae bacterium]|jgi:hypothetical protein|nr:DUF3021 domain-containing protein [Christensenellaceae bacterium]
MNVKKTLLRALLGFPLGLAIGYSITILVSLSLASRSGGEYLPCAPALAQELGGELNAVLAQAALCGLLGAAFAAASRIWDVERFSLAKQSGLYFLAASAAMLPVAYLARWMERSLLGFAQYFSIFLAVFVFNWLIQYAVWRIRLRRINQSLPKEE